MGGGIVHTSDENAGMPDAALAPGDAVQQRGRKPVMFVRSVSGDAVTCSWHEGDRVRTGTFRAADLERVPDIDVSGATPALETNPVVPEFGQGAIVRATGGGEQLMFVVTRTSRATLTCGWIDEEGKVQLAEFGVAELEPVSPFGESEEAWLEAYRSGWKVLEHYRWKKTS